MEKEFDNLLEDFKIIKFKTINAGYDYGFKVWDDIEQAITELKAIKEAKPSEALEELEKVIEEITISNTDLRNTLKTSVLIASIKQALLKAQGQEKLFKHINRNDMENVIPLSTIIADLSQDDKYKFIEHIYYTWAELNEKYEKLSDEYKRTLQKNQENETVLEIIKEKRVDLCILTDCDNVNEYNKSLGNFRPVEDRLTYDEFVLLKRWNNEKKK